MESRFGVTLAVCHSLLHQRTVDAALVAMEGAQLESFFPNSGFEELVAAVSVAWSIEVGEGGNVAVCLPSCRVLLNGQPIHEGQPQLGDCRVVPLRRRSFPQLIKSYRRQQEAFEAADVLPPGFLWVWAQDVTGSNVKGAKQYLVGSLDDFWSHYRGVPPAKRNFYEVIRRPDTCFHADLEYSLELGENRARNPLEMLSAFKELVAQESQMALDMTRWEVSDSSRDPMVLSDEQEEKGAGKVSFHVLHPDLAFSSIADHEHFCQRLRDRAPPTLFVVAKKRPDAFFADLSIYSKNRCFRLLYSTKAGEERFLLPISGYDGEMRRDAWERGLVGLNRPSATIIRVQAPIPRHVRPQDQIQPQVAANDDDGDDPFLLLKAEIERHFQPESMRAHFSDDTGLCTFPMVNHNCSEICHREHSNQVYAVADLKQGVFYAKCHVDRLKKGPDHPFSARPSLVDGARELVPGGLGGTWTFPAASVSAQRVLRFLRAVFVTKSGGGVPDRIPEAGTQDVVYNSHEHQYVFSLGVCPTDGGQLQLTLGQSGAVIRCIGAMHSHCSRQGWRLERPSRSSTAHKKWDLSFILPTATPPDRRPQQQQHYHQNHHDDSSAQEAFLVEPNLFKALGFESLTAATSLTDLFADRIKTIEAWAKLRQANAPANQRDASGVHVLAARIQHKAFIARGILLNHDNEMAYRECLMIAPDFEYPLELVPKSPVLILVALWVFLAKRKGFKRIQEDFYVPTTSADGQRVFYTAISLDQLLTRVCHFDQTPNLCALMWSSRTSGDMERMLRDENHWPSIQPSTRYLGFQNAVYDLEQNVAISWERARDDFSIMPFNCLDEDLPLDVLEEARRTCPTIVVRQKRVVFTNNNNTDGDDDGGFWIDTPLFDKMLIDQGFDQEVRFWNYVFFGRMFHRVGKNNGDNWEICPISLGAPGTGKSSGISVLQSFLQPSQFGILATKTEKRFPITSLHGKHMVFLTETGGCDLDKELLKQMTSGDPVTVATKFKMAVILPSWDVPLWLAGNRFLDCVDTDGSLERRCAVFPYTRILPQGEGDVGLVKRIIQQERAILLIKCNTLYLAMKKTVRELIHPLLPPLIQEATRQALMQNDSLRLYLVQSHIVEPNNFKARMPWTAMWDRYIKWCQHTGNRPYPADPHSPEVCTMINKLGAQFKVHNGMGWLVFIRPRTAADPPFVSAFEVQTMGQDDNDDMDWSE